MIECIIQVDTEKILDEADATWLIKHEELIRCNNCIHWRKLLLNEDGHGQCTCEGPTKYRVTAPEFYCADGRKKYG